jgi:uncharacterized protein YndB with AHSA1/START domain
MARNEVLVDAPPERVWSVLADPDLYGEWVFGAFEVQESTGEWPNPGSTLEFDVGIGPLTIGDETRVLEADEPNRLLFRARAGRSATVRIEIKLTPQDGGTLVQTEEDVSGGAAGILPRMITDLLIGARHAWSPERLRDLVEREVNRPPVVETSSAAP